MEFTEAQLNDPSQQPALHMKWGYPEPTKEQPMPAGRWMPDEPSFSAHQKLMENRPIMEQIVKLETPRRLREAMKAGVQSVAELDAQVAALRKQLVK